MDLILLLQQLLPEQWYTTLLYFLSVLGGLCAVICTLLPAPSSVSSDYYVLAYKILNALGANFGKAKNADDIKVKD